jgi:metal-responsive CopG/Arc/MetJ family transcriptional regulator
MATKTFNIALDEKLLQKVNQVVKQEMSSRSEYFRRLAIADIMRKQEYSRILDSANSKGKKLGIKNEEDVYKALQIK